MIMKLKMHVASKNFEKICLKAIRDPFFKYVVCDQGRMTGLNFLVGDVNYRRAKFKLPIKITLMRVLGLFTVIILKIVSGSIFLQSNKFTACIIKDGKKVANSLTVFNLLKIMHPFQGKKH